MKKALIVLLALCFVGAFAFAEDAAAPAAPANTITFAASGGVWLKYGVDLDTMYTGFQNANDGLELTMLIGSQTYTKTGTGTYGYINIGNVRFWADTGWGGVGGGWGSISAFNLKWDDVSAKLVLGDLSLTVFGTPSTNVNLVGQVSDDTLWLQNAYSYNIRSGAFGGTNIASTHNNDADNGVYFAGPESTPFQSVAYNLPYAHSLVGTDATYALGTLGSVGLVVGSDGDWTQNSLNTYAFKFHTALTPVDGLAFNLEAGYGTMANSPFVAGAKVSYAAKIADGFVITPAAAFGLSYTTAATWNALGGVKVEVAKSVFTANFGIDSSNAWLLAVAGTVGAVDNLTLNAAFQLSSANAFGIAWELGYGIVSDGVTIKPFLNGSYDTITAAAGSLFVAAGVSVTGAVPNTSFQVEWDSNNLMGTTATLGQVWAGVRIGF